MWLTGAIVFYIVGLLTFYTYAVFDTKAWDLAYFGWAKSSEVGILAWGALYHEIKGERRMLVKWLFYYSFVRFALDVQSFFTGAGVNTEPVVAASFLLLMLIVCALTITEFRKINKHL